MDKVHKTVKQECNCCGKRFDVRYCSDGTCEYIGEVCDCEADFSPVDDGLSISEWIEYLKWRGIIK